MHDDRLYVADIGDNRADRDFVTVYFFDNAAARRRTVAYRACDFSYPDGPHDAETLLVDDDGPAVHRHQGRGGRRSTRPRAIRRGTASTSSTGSARPRRP